MKVRRLAAYVLFALLPQAFGVARTWLMTGSDAESDQPEMAM